MESSRSPAPSPGLLRHPSLVLVFAAAWGVMRLAWGEIGDDALITFTYARNLVEGAGFVFNPGERVYGTTAPLWGLFAALGIKLGVAPWTWALAWDVVFGGVVLWRLRELLETVERVELFPLVGGLMLATSSETMHLAGMETGLYTALVLGSLAAMARGRAPWQAMTWAAWAAALRPDGVVILGVAGVWSLMRLRGGRDWRPWVAAAAPLAIPTAAALAVLAWFGTLVPQSAVAKAVVADRAPFIHSFWFGLLRRLVWYHGMPSLAAMLAVVGVAAWWREARLRPVALFAIGYIAFFVAGRAPGFPWYYTPLAVLACLYAVLGAAWIVGAVAARRPGRTVSAPAWIFVVVGLAVLPQLPGMLSLGVRAALDLRIDLSHRKYREISDLIRQESTGTPSLATTEIGYFGYFLRGHVFDIYGLVTPASIEAIRRGESPIFLTDAEWYVVPVQVTDPVGVDEEARAPADAAGYALHSTWQWPGGWTYVFRRPPADS